jgi:dTDP-4-dehydrorhamnose 3,5-epimerase
MQVIDTKILEVKIIEPKVFGDERGFFLETFHSQRYLDSAGIDLAFV